MDKQLVEKLLTYDPATGIFRWKVNRGGIKAGSVAGTDKRGYIIIRILGRNFRAHRLAWLMVYGSFPDHDLDHRDGVRNNNAISNIRIATKSDNNRNRSARLESKTGSRGVFSQGSKFRAQMQRGGKKFHLGLFDTVEEATEAYSEAAKSIDGIFYNSVN